MTIHTGLYFICNHCTYAIPIYCLICCFIAYVLFLCDKYVLLDILLVNKIYIYIFHYSTHKEQILRKLYTISASIRIIVVPEGPLTLPLRSLMTLEVIQEHTLV